MSEPAVVPAVDARRPADQLPALRAARAVLKQQLKDSTKEIRKEARPRIIGYAGNGIFVACADMGSKTVLLALSLLVFGRCCNDSWPRFLPVLTETDFAACICPPIFFNDALA